MSASRQQTASEGWRLQGDQAVLSAPSLDASIALQHPSRGLSALRIAGAAVEGGLLRVDVQPPSLTGALSDEALSAPWHVHDAYVRGCDLVATYREPLGQPLNVQIYWRVPSDGGEALSLLDAIVSIQTPHWEAYPSVSICSSLPADEVVTMPNLLLYRTGEQQWRTGEQQWSYAEFSIPGDFTLTPLNPPQGEIGARWQFGKQFMERGVIRRLHLRAAIIPRANDIATAAQLLSDLLAEHPPLTT